MARMDRPLALGEVEALLRRDHPDLHLTADAHYGEVGFAYLNAFGVSPDRKDEVLRAAKEELARRGFPVEPIHGKDVMDVRAIPPGTRDE